MIKKKLVKKITAVAVSVVLSVMSCMTVSAYYVNEIGWSADPCPKCKEDVAIWIKEIRMKDSLTGERLLCQHHHRFGVDIEVEACTITYYECREEGCDYFQIEENRSRFWICQGYDDAGIN